ncbi:MAG TPA: NAD-dependent epimerase/dehydratase family protein [Afifellaceae bacterium]|nr:NAD-dependent epimerase/dehydratase family protein [Afifellaceae bacterium]
MTILVTGAAGFIGFHAARQLLNRGDRVVGVDDLSSYYSISLKQARLAALARFGTAFRFVHADIADLDALQNAVTGERIERILHLAAQPGVRYSLENPLAYGRANITGHLNVLELARHLDGLAGVTYASSSSVYGGNDKVPFSETDRVDRPVSLYAATKRADELMSHAYAHLFALPLTGLRFFTVYGPWGRPDMAVWSFTDKILDGATLPVFDGGRLERDFTYIDDIVDATIATLDDPARAGEDGVPHRLYNIGNNRPVAVNRLIELIEAATGRRAKRVELPRPAGDVERTFADISAIARDYGFQPKTPLEEGIPRFVEWYRR